MWPLLFLWNTELFSVFLSTLTAILIFVVTINIIKYMTSDLHIPIRDTSKQHNWRHAKLLSKPCYCSVCEALMVTGEGAYCDCCGVCADRGCIKTADRKIKCKAITSCEKGPARHHWVKGNLPLGASCYVCDEDCGSEYGLVDWQCCWCQRTVHSRCRIHIEEVCDFGPYRSHLIPPSCVVLTKKRSTVRRKLQLRAVKSPGWKDWTPLIVMANRKSGNNDGAIILSLFRRLLNPAQVVDLAEHPPETALEWCCLLGEVRATVLVAGGDGTIGWVLNAVDKLQLKPSPGVAILPIGTGNDLSRVLGWGKEHHPNFDPGTFLEQVQKARLVELDRWNVQVHPYRHLGIRLPVRNMNMYNYLSVGVDAQVTLDFHRTRESPFYIISSRLINKMLYLTYGTQQVMERGFRDLDQRLEVYLDGVKAELPSIESIVVLNIPSWGAGVHLWNMGADNEDIAPQSYNDNKLEVVALYSSFHIAQLQVGLSQPYRVGQASCVQIKLKALTPVQVDGEPWEQHPAELNITFRNQATVLTCVEVG
ncbi:diacylglycerol kinase epsilon isoform X1 [Periplaneta americana]|uniref:diacylglycerol kinase epsilon isoform X1 n=1 Tax=Periplaneta americana TaxID=6978 RepID=UPI0037E766C8